MKGTELIFHGVQIVAYIFDTNESIPWHQHPKPHGHWVLNGRTRIEIADQEPFEMQYGMANVEMPGNIQHQITALEPGTVFLHISLGNPNEE